MSRCETCVSRKVCSKPPYVPCLTAAEWRSLGVGTAPAVNPDEAEVSRRIIELGPRLSIYHGGRIVNG